MRFRPLLLLQATERCERGSLIRLLPFGRKTACASAEGKHNSPLPSALSP